MVTKKKWKIEMYRWTEKQTSWKEFGNLTENVVKKTINISIRHWNQREIIKNVLI